MPGLGPGSVDPQVLALGVGLARQGISRSRSGRMPSVRVVSVDGGHCALWLEPAASLRALFPVPGLWPPRNRSRIG